MFTETRTLNLQRTPSLRLLSFMLQTGSGQLGSNLKALPDGRLSLRELLLGSFSQFHQVMAGGFYPPICKSTRRYGGQAGGWLIHWSDRLIFIMGIPMQDVPLSSTRKVVFFSFLIPGTCAISVFRNDKSKHRYIFMFHKRIQHSKG